MSMSQVEHVITSRTVEINAPAAAVWDVLVDYATYPEWNPFTVAVETTLEVGAPIDLTLPSYDGSGDLFVSHEIVRVVERPHHLRYDNGTSVPGVLGVRDQWITSLWSDRCSYVTTNTLSGEHAELAISLTGEWIRAGFDAVGQALKLRVESLT